MTATPAASAAADDPHAAHDTHAGPTELSFTFDGRTITAAPGQTIAAALYAAGVRVFSRSFKYHRPRGLFCVSGDCPTCLMQVDGRPNVRTCTEPVCTGQVVEPQNVWPALGFDVLRTFDRFDRFLPVGFYYKQFHKPRWLWPVFEHVVRHIAGLGKVDVHDHPEVDAELEHIHTEVCVVGGGPAGLAAAAEAAEAGARVVLVEREAHLGGHLLYDGDQPADDQPFLAAVNGDPRIEVLTRATAFGLYEGNLLGVAQGDRFIKIRAKQTIVCTGGRQQPFLFHNNDLPGIMLGRGAQRLMRLYGVMPGRRAVILTDTDDGHRLAEQMQSAGIEVAAVVDLRLGERPSATWTVLPGHAVLRAHGNMHLTGVTVGRVSENGTVQAEQTLACDLLCLASALAPANELLHQGGLRFRFEGGRWRPTTSVPGLIAAGAAGGTFGLSAQLLEGRLRGAEAATALGHQSAQLDAHRRAWQELADSTQGTATCCAAPASTGAKRFVCLCEDVTEKDLDMAVAEGFDHVETLKRYSTVNMGPCQGKVCGQTAAAACARLTGRDLTASGTTTSRPPLAPIELGVLAAGQKHHAVRRTPLHDWHEAAGARWLDAGLWKRPESYGNPVNEVRTVRTAVGLIDVSTLGKIELVGPGAAELLERIYLNKWADLKPGRARYGAMCNEEGVIIDDGVGARLSAERFYLTATTGNAEGVFQWLQLWRDIWHIDVVLINQTSAWSAMNLAGPRARDVLSRLTRLDLSPAAFPYMALREADVAGVPCRMQRVGFVGELGYEIHCPSAWAGHLWEELVKAGIEFGLRPFGVEAQRVLRLEKGHIIIGQDTDALSTPLDAGLEWMVRFDKPHFHGREALLKLKAMGSRSRLLGFRMLDTERVPLEGCQVVERGRSVGRVASARYSPTLERSIGLAWVPPGLRPGDRFHIRWNGADVPAVVAAVPFYDPEGARLKA
jgi:sarcosine oxidase subunit alpha